MTTLSESEVEEAALEARACAKSVNHAPSFRRRPEPRIGRIPRIEI